MNMVLNSLLALIVLSMLWNLGSALHYILNPHKSSAPALRALQKRVLCALGLFLLLIGAAWMGWLQPQVPFRAFHRNLEPIHKHE